MYDWANSAFATIMLAAIFPVFFMAMAGGEGSLGSAWWGWAGSIRMVIMAICAPLIGSLLAFNVKRRNKVTAGLVIASNKNRI